MLTATISPTADDNKIKGTISNLESWNPTGHWEVYEGGFTTATLEDGSIGADGAFKGVATDPDSAADTAFANGFYKGSFHGPLNGLEAAGTRAVPVGSTGSKGVIGSFGAKMRQAGRVSASTPGPRPGMQDGSGLDPAAFASEKPSTRPLAAHGRQKERCGMVRVRKSALNPDNVLAMGLPLA